MGKFNVTLYDKVFDFSELAELVKHFAVYTDKCDTISHLVKFDIETEYMKSPLKIEAKIGWAAFTWQLPFNLTIQAECGYDKIVISSNISTKKKEIPNDSEAAFKHDLFNWVPKEMLKFLIEMYPMEEWWLVVFEGGGYDGCIWEYNYFFLHKHYGIILPIHISGSIGDLVVNRIMQLCNRNKDYWPEIIKEYANGKRSDNHHLSTLSLIDLKGDEDEIWQNIQDKAPLGIYDRIGIAIYKTFEKEIEVECPRCGDVTYLDEIIIKDDLIYIEEDFICPTCYSQALNELEDPDDEQLGAVSEEKEEQQQEEEDTLTLRMFEDE